MNATLDRHDGNEPAMSSDMSPDMMEDTAGTARRCIVTGDTGARGGLIRFVAGPDGVVTPDLAEKLPGRGLWVAADRDALARADVRVFSRAQRGQVEVPADLAARIEAALARRLADYLGMARRAGALVAGFEKCRAALKGGTGAALLAASDGAADGRAKLRALAPALEELAPLTAAEMGCAIGREAAVHAVVTDAALARRIAREARRLAGVRGTYTDTGDQARDARERAFG